MWRVSFWLQWTLNNVNCRQNDKMGSSMWNNEREFWSSKCVYFNILFYLLRAVYYRKFQTYITI